MNRRSACVALLLALLKASLLAPFAAAAQEAARSLSRIAGPRWNVNGDWSPSLEEIQRHLRDAHGIDPRDLGREDLLTLHDNDHNRRGSVASPSHKKSPKSSAKGYSKF
jgi:hypothetical protein